MYILGMFQIRWSLSILLPIIIIITIKIKIKLSIQHTHIYIYQVNIYYKIYIRYVSTIAWEKPSEDSYVNA